MMMLDSTQPIIATGRRKTATASVSMLPGKGDILINKKDFEDYFTTVSVRNHVLQPLVVMDVAKKVNVTVRTRGGGNMGQAGAVRLALARALLKMDPESRTLLRKHGLLTRDPREKERKKSGQPGARKRFQFSKR